MNRLLFFITLLLTGQVAMSQSNYRNWTVREDVKKERIALIVANSDYTAGGSLDMPIPMAKKLEKSLIDKGFDVSVGHDLDRGEMIDIIGDFSKKYRSYKFAIIFYLGHGFQIDGENYLIPIDANPQSKSDVEVEAIDVEYVLKKVNDADIPKVIVLDACRDNPFEKKWSSAERSGNKNGFGDVSAPLNAEIFFTTQKDSRVRDDNPYLDYFMQELKKQDCLEDIVRNVSKRVNKDNQGQIPAKYGQLFDKVCFGNTPPPPNPNPEPIKDIDTDHDGIIDRLDECPNEFGTMANKGCPEKGRPIHKLETIRPHVMPKPSFNGNVGYGGGAPDFSLRQTSSATSSFVLDEDWLDANGFQLPQYEVPNARRNTTGNLPAQVPKSYMGAPVTRGIFADDYQVFIYGVDLSSSRYMVITDRNANNILHFIDFNNYGNAPSVKPGDEDYVFEGIRWAVVENDVLYVSHFHKTYASSTYGKNGYITAIDLGNYEVLWRSQPLVCNAYNFQVIGNCVVTGYGFTAEKDYLYQLNKQTGAVVKKTYVKTGPSYIFKRGNKLYVRTYSEDYEFVIE